MKQSAVKWLSEQIEQHVLTFGNLPINVLNEKTKQALEIENKQSDWKLVSEEFPPIDIDLFVQSPEGIIHLSKWRPAYNIFTCQGKKESSMDWKWKKI